MNELKKLLSVYQEVVVFDDSEIQKLNQITEVVEFVEGDMIFQANDLGDSLYLVISGAVDLFTEFSDNLEQTIMSVQQGGIVGAMALIDNDIREINARASEKTRLYKIAREEIIELISKDSAIGIKIFKLLTDILSKRLRIAMTSLRQNLEWTMQVSGIAALDLSQLVVDQTIIDLDLSNGTQLSGTIMKAEERPGGFELFMKSDDGKIYIIPYHAIVTASLPFGTAIDPSSKLQGI